HDRGGPQQDDRRRLPARAAGRRPPASGRRLVDEGRGRVLRRALPALGAERSAEPRHAEPRRPERRGLRSGRLTHGPGGARNGSLSSPRSALMLLALIPLGARAASAAAPTVRFEYHKDAGSEACPDEAAIKDAVAARLGYDAFAE